MGQDVGITDREIGFWVTPHKALSFVVGPSNDVGILTSAAKEILRRMGLGLIQVRAKKTLVELNGTKSDLGPNRLVHSQILRVWEAYPRPFSLPIWEKSSMKIAVPDGEQVPGSARTYDLFGLRLDPKGVNDLLDDFDVSEWGRPQRPPEPTVWPIPNGAPVTPPALEPEQKGPPVSEAALRAWYEAFKMAFPGNENTEARAMESAKGCFPGKSFSREAVRELRGEQKRGPKPKSAK